MQRPNLSPDEVKMYLKVIDTKIMTSPIFGPAYQEELKEITRKMAELGTKNPWDVLSESCFKKERTEFGAFGFTKAELSLDFLAAIAIEREEDSKPGEVEKVNEDGPLTGEGAYKLARKLTERVPGIKVEAHLSAGKDSWLEVIPSGRALSRELLAELASLPQHRKIEMAPSVLEYKFKIL